MQQNTHGYVTELEYTGHYYENQNPILLNYIAGLNGLNPVDKLQKFTYCELGCGKGVTLNVLADANPDSQFIGIDFNEEHIKAARQQAEDCNITNVRYFPVSFEQMQTLDLPDFDYITLHGVYTWVSPELRGHINAFLKRKLATGGLVMVSYNALPGKALEKILRDMMLTYAESQPVSLLEKTSHGIAYLDYLVQHQAPFFQQNPAAAKKVAAMKSKDMRYIAHEYFNQHWDPMYFAEVYKAMRGAGLQFAGQTEILLNYTNLAFPANLQQDFDKNPDRISLEIHRAFIMNEEFRRDVYIKSTPPQTQTTPVAKRFAYISLTDPDRFNDKIKAVSGIMELQGEIFKALVAQIYCHAQTIDQLLQQPALEQYSEEQITDALHKLLIGRQVRVAVPSPKPAKSLSKYNQTVMAQPTFDPVVLSSPVLGEGIAFNGLDILMLKGSQQQDLEAGINYVISVLTQAGKCLLDKKGEKIEQPEALKAAVKQHLEQAKNSIQPLMQGLGILP
jgi:ubiquinone/menaquinone biosynthesis C-methylase UbiE